MVLKPQSREELSRALAEASRSRAKILAADLSSLAALIEHHPEDMTATVEGGMTLRTFQKHLQRAGQWLPIDPPEDAALTMTDVLASDLSGPRRLGYGTIRDYLIGIRVALANGDIIHAGGKVVKNVAGYDLCKLFIGARNSLGIIVEGAFKLRPLPELEVILAATFDHIAPMTAAARAIIDSPVEPILLDGHNLHEKFTLVLGIAGAREDVDYQLGIVRAIAGFAESNTIHSDEFARAVRRPARISVRPSEITGALQKLDRRPFVARLGNGVVYYEGEVEERPLSNALLMKRVKHTYDPAGIFPEYLP